MIFFGCSILSSNKNLSYSLNTEYQEKVDPKVSDTSVIEIITPENKTYMKSSGHYLCSYDFEDYSDYNGYYGTADDVDGHNIVFKTSYHGITFGGSNGHMKHLFPAPSTGSFEYYFRTEDASRRVWLTAWPISFWVENDNWMYEYIALSPEGGLWVIRDSINLGGYKPLDNKWHHIRIDFECGNARWKLNVDGHSSSWLNMWQELWEHPTPPCIIRSFYMRGELDPPTSCYIDGIGFSWDPEYNLGDNLKEGIQIKFQKLIDRNFNWWSYSIDGQANVTIPGNKIVEMPEYGSHTIQIYGEDEYFNVYGSNITRFHVGPFNVLTPNPSTDWEDGNTYDITWISEGNIQNVSLEIYKGQSHRFSIPNMENDGLFTWTIPEDTQRGSDWRIKISNYSNPSLYSWSEDFSIITFIEMITPLESYSLETGFNHTIRWTTKGSINSVDIEVYKGGIYNFTLAIGTENDGIYSWYIPFETEPGTDWEIKIIDSDNSSIYVWSGEFKIFTFKSITMKTPASNSFWERGSIQYITWTSTGNITHVEIDVFKGGFEVYSVANRAINDWAKYWEIPLDATPDTDYSIRISDSNNASLFTFSDEFEIYSRPDLLITNPHDISHWEAGKSYYITWTMSARSNITHVNIDVYKGTTLMYSLGTTESDGEYLWNIPDDPPPGDDWNILITDFHNPSTFSKSDPFEIYTDKSISIITPSSLTNWSASRTYNRCNLITWTSTGAISNVNIELWDATGLIFTIVNETENDGLFNWAIPSNIQPDSDYRIKIIVSDYLSIVDLSDNFNIYILKTITITYPNRSEIWRGSQYYDITWESTGAINNVGIELYKNDILVNTISSSTINDGRFLWRVPQNLADNDASFKIKIYEVSNHSVFDLSDNSFEILKSGQISLMIPIFIVVGSILIISVPIGILFLRKYYLKKRIEP
ncbi:MAG: Ser-Thr-rich GPI-anchored membrane family protein [Promethearchaeota archaeon]